VIPVPLIAFPIALLAALLLGGGTGFWGYEHGIAIQEARQTKTELAQANANIADMKRKDEAAAKAGESHDANVRVVRDTTREIVRTVTIPPVADVYLPVGFVRMFDRAASRSIGADPYPGKSDGDPSDVKVSEAQSLLASNYGDVCEANRTQLADLIAYLKNDRPPAEKSTWLERLGL
jgi:hypothetical protein